MKNIVLLFAIVLAPSLALADQITNNSDLNPGFSTIIGGSEVSASDPVASTTVLVVAKEDDNTNSMSICSGTIIAKNLVLTAAHCIGMDGQAKAAVVFRTKIEGQGPVVAVADRRRPADFLDRARAGDTDWHDLAVLKLAQPIPAGYQVAKFLPTPFSVRNGSSVTLAGYGMNIPLTPSNPEEKSGSGILRKVDQTVISANFAATEFLVSLANNKGACHGDSGGPAYVRQNNQLFLFGVASRMTDKDRVANNGDVRDFSCSVEMVYTNAVSTESAAWISQSVRELGAL